MKTILIIIFLSTVTYSWETPSLNQVSKYANKVKSIYSSYKKGSDSSPAEYKEKTDISGISDRPRNTTGKLLRLPLNIENVFSSNNCDQVIKKEAYTSCYYPDLKISTMVYYQLQKKDLILGYTKKRPSFYPEKGIPNKYRAKPKEYKRTNFDKGHIRSHASTAYDKSLLYQTYSMINIWPQRPKLNRQTWIKSEKYERLVARKKGIIHVLNIAYIKRDHLTIGKGIVVPAGFYKILYSTDDDFKRCFYYSNKILTSIEVKKDKLKNHEVDCNKIRY